MKKQSVMKRFLAAGLSAAMLMLAAAGCGGDGSSGTSGASTGSKTESAPASSAAGTSSTAEGGDASLPLTTEPVTLRFWYNVGSANGLSDYNESDFYQWMEEQTGVHIEWTMPVEGTENESFNLLFASDNMPDLIQNQLLYGRGYPTGPDMSIADGVYLKLNDYEQYMPYYMALINADPQLQKDTVTDEGNRWCFNYLYAGEGGRKGNMGPAIRKDFLEAVGKDIPVTYDDWHDVLTAFKEELNIEIPLFYASSENDGTTNNSEFMAGFGVSKDFYLDGSDVKYGPLEDGYGEYLEIFKQWYAEGLVDQSFSTRSGVMDDDLILNDKIGAIGTTYASYCGDKYYPSRGATNPDFCLVGAPIPVKQAGDVTHVRNPDLITNAVEISISASTEYPELAVKWMDYQYSEEASFVANYGNREGESYIKLDDGTYKWGELITNNADGLTQNQARTKFTTLNAPYEDYNRVMGSWTDDQLAAQQTWVASKDDGVISTSVTMTQDEQEELASIMGDITTYVAEYTVNTIMGQSTASFEDFRTQLKNMGIERAIELKQAGVDRYNSR